MNTATTDRSSRRSWLIAGSAAGVLVIALVGWLILGAGSGEPRLNESTPVLVKFVSSRAFDRMPYEKQRLYYRILDDRGKEIEQAFKEGKVSEGECRTALDAAWLGKHINRFEKYASLPAGRMRTAYIDELLVKKAAKDAKKDKKDNKVDDPLELNEDEAAAEMRVESWPPAVREQWNLFHDAYRREKKAREEAAARPTSRTNE
jgi:hypothetical protein